MKAKPSKTPGKVDLELSRNDELLMEAATQTAAIKPPFKIKRILVPIDFSDCSKKALAYALPLAKEYHAQVTLLYVVAPIATFGEFSGIDSGQLESELREKGAQELAKLRQEILGNEVTTECLTLIGSPFREIVETAKRLESDLIVISTHGRTGLKHVFLGSVVEHVVQRAPCPVFVVRETEHEILT